MAIKDIEIYKYFIVLNRNKVQLNVFLTELFSTTLALHANLTMKHTKTLIIEEHYKNKTMALY